MSWLGGYASTLSSYAETAVAVATSTATQVREQAESTYKDVNVLVSEKGYDGALYAGVGKAQATVIRTYEDANADFAAQQANNDRQAAEGRRQKAAAVPLWTCAAEDQTILEGELKQQILALPTTDKVWTDCALLEGHDPEFPFQLDACEIWALKAIECDPLLDRVRYRLVKPKGYTDDVFWRAYFYQVFSLRKSLGLAQLFDPSGDGKSRSDMLHGGMLHVAANEEEETQFTEDLSKFIEEDDFVAVSPVNTGAGGDGDDDAEGDELELENLEEMLADVQVEDEGDGVGEGDGDGDDGGEGDDGDDLEDALKELE
jgi:hypothetical protein